MNRMYRKVRDGIDYSDRLSADQYKGMVGMDISEVRDALGRWWILESQNHNVVTFERAGFGRLTFYIDNNNVVERVEGKVRGESFISDSRRIKDSDDSNDDAFNAAIAAFDSVYNEDNMDLYGYDDLYIHKENYGTSYTAEFSHPNPSSVIFEGGSGSYKIDEFIQDQFYEIEDGFIQQYQKENPNVDDIDELRNIVFNDVNLFVSEEFGIFYTVKIINNYNKVRICFSIVGYNENGMYEPVYDEVICVDETVDIDDYDTIKDIARSIMVFFEDVDFS